MLSREMVEHRLLRVDFLGSAPGMWSIHPPHRSKLFYDSLPELIARVETDDLPDVQRGDRDINEGVIELERRAAASVRARADACRASSSATWPTFSAVSARPPDRGGASAQREPKSHLRRRAPARAPARPLRAALWYAGDSLSRWKQPAHGSVDGSAA